MLRFYCLFIALAIFLVTLQTATCRSIEYETRIRRSAELDEDPTSPDTSLEGEGRQKIDSDLGAVVLKPVSSMFDIREIINQLVRKTGGSSSESEEAETSMSTRPETTNSSPGENGTEASEEEEEEEERSDGDTYLNENPTDIWESFETTASEGRGIDEEPTNPSHIKSEPDADVTPEGIDPEDPEEIARKEFYGNRSSGDTFANIVNINKHVNLTGVKQGDIKEFVSRNAAVGNKWPKTTDGGSYRGKVRIPFRISRSFNSTHREVIRDAMAKYAKYTCIRFTPRVAEIAYILISDGVGCWAYVGKTGYAAQTVSLGIPGCVGRGIVLHELMHAVGFQHEHSRSDRDQYVRILHHNIQGEMSLNFERYNNTQNLVVYDYRSVMHYSKNAFSKQPYLPSIQITPKRKPEPTIGQRTRLSPYDIEEIKYLYDCAPGSYERCGRDFVDQVSGSFQSPSYPSAYPKESHCTWNITVRRGRYVKVTFKGIDIKDSNLCQDDAILVHDGRTAAAPVLQTICGTQAADVEITSTGRTMFIIFSSDTARNIKSGFRAIFRETTQRGQSPSPPVLPTLPPITHTVNNRFQCDFESGVCGMTQDSLDQLDWLRTRGATPSRDTGPSADHTTGRGYYIFVESSLPATAGDNAIIRSPWFRGSSDFCVSYSYHMLGGYMGGLRLYAFEKRTTDNYGHEVLLWEKYGNQGGNWITKEISYQPRPNVQSVQFYWETFVFFYQSDIALDDLEVTPGSCSFARVSSTSSPRLVAWTTNRKPTTLSPTTSSTSRRTTTPRSTTTTTTVPTTTAATVYSSINCSFDSSLCSFKQSSADNFDWTRKSGPTPSHSTGPTVDHTSGTGHYMFVEASSPRRLGHVARLVSPLLTPRKHCLHMWYHMFGKQTGKLTISQVIDGTPTVLMEKIGDSGNQWLPLTVEVNSAVVRKSVRRRDHARDDSSQSSQLIDPNEDMDEEEEEDDGATSEGESQPQSDFVNDLSHDALVIGDSPAGGFQAHPTLQIVIEASIGRGYAGDIAIDDITITSDACQDTVTNIASPSLLSELACDFESAQSLCGIEQSVEDDFDWLPNSGKTGSSGTGPSADHTTSTEEGLYLYIESSSPRRVNDIAELITPKFNPGRYCVRFYSHMYGSATGQLKVYTLEEPADGSDGVSVRRWSESGNHGDVWDSQSFDFTSTSSSRSVQFIFQGRVGTSFTSDIALDDISITSGECTSTAVRSTPPTPRITSTTRRPTTTTTTRPTTTTTTPRTTTTTTTRPTTTTTTTRPTTTTTTTRPTTTTTTTTPTTTTTTTRPTTTTTTTRPTTTTTTTRPTTTTTTTRPTTTTTTTRPTTTTTTTRPTTTTTTTRPTTTTTTTRPTTTTTTTRPTTTTTTTRPTTTTTTTRPTTTTTTTRPTTTTRATTTRRNSGQTVAISPYPTAFACDFERINLCGMTQARDDRFDWIRQAGNTPSGGTGPRVDHTSNLGGRGNFVFIESSSPRRRRDTAVLETPNLSVETPKRCVTFWYHMWGHGMGALRVNASFVPSQRSRKSASSVGPVNSVIFAQRGNQGQNWIMGRVEVDQDLDYYGGSVQIKFTAERGVTYQGDLALDDVCVAEGPCDDASACSPSGAMRSTSATTTARTRRPPATSRTTTTTRRTTTLRTTTTTQRTTTTPPPTTTRTATTVRQAPRNGPVLWSGMPLCTFETNRQSTNQINPPSGIPGDSTNDLGTYVLPDNLLNDRLCGWRQLDSRHDQFDWTRHRGRTNSQSTGPDGDHTTTRGYYMYIEASSPRKLNDVASLQTYAMPPSDYCIDVNYHMYGTFAGRLSVRSIQRLTNSRHVISYLNNIAGNQGNSWRNVKVDYSPRSNAVTTAFRIEGVRGKDYRSDIAVDDITILPGNCSACQDPSHRFVSDLNQEQRFTTGCINSELFWVRCCSLTQEKAVYRRVQQCDANMFTAERLNWYCDFL